MNFCFKDVVIAGLKVLAAITSGAIVFLGLGGNKMFKKKSSLPEEPKGEMCPTEECCSVEEVKRNVGMIQQERESNLNEKVLGGLRRTTEICSASLDVFRSLSDVVCSIGRLFSSSPQGYYGNSPSGYLPGNYPWNRPEYVGSPYNTPINQGKDSRNNDVFWIHRPNGIIEVW